MRISDQFSLGRSQGELDFVDVQVDRDTPLFVDPAALRHIQGTWTHSCIALIQDFFQTVIDAIRDGRRSDALTHLRGLREPNETRLGLPSGTPRGRTLGPESAEHIYGALERSEATRTGLLSHLEDTALLVRGVGPDIVSDIATNLMRRPLIEYTQRMARQYSIPLEAGVTSGHLWDVDTHAWREGALIDLPIAAQRRLLLVPKAVVRSHPEYDADEYLKNFILPILEAREIAAGTELVRTIKYNGALRVYKNGHQTASRQLLKVKRNVSHIHNVLYYVDRQIYEEARLPSPRVRAQSERRRDQRVDRGCGGGRGRARGARLRFLARYVLDRLLSP